MNSLRQKFHDFLVIFKTVWLILLFLVFGLVAFVIVEQGQDMLFSTIDNFDLVKFIFSLGALSFWAVQTSFGSRFLITFSDVSFFPGIAPTGFSPEQWTIEIKKRVQRRRTLMSWIPRKLFYMPFLIMEAGYIKAFITYSTDPGDWITFSGIATGIAFSAYLSYKFAFFAFQKTAMKNASEEATKQLLSLHRATSLKSIGKVRHAFITNIILSVFLIFIFSFLSGNAFRSLGAVSIITLSFGCWITILYFIDYLDKYVLGIIKISLLILLCIISYFNEDHPVRQQGMKNKSHAPLSLESRFTQWFSENKFDKSRATPVFFISAEGGGARSAYWTSMVLAQLQDSLPDFHRHLFSYSSVSGGTLGAHVFKCIQKYKSENKGEKRSHAELTRLFYKKDFLAAVTGRMVFGEVFNLFSPWMIRRFDRSAELEKSWEESMGDIDPGNNNFDNEFNEANAKGPAVFLNSTEVETGKRAVLSNVDLDSDDFSDVIDLRNSIDRNISYSTAILLSARFPYFTPAASVQNGTDNSQRRHYVDGGYFENMGNTTTGEVIRAVKYICETDNIPILPVVILISNDYYGKDNPLRFGNEVLEPLAAIMNVRGGHTSHSLQRIQNEIKTPPFRGNIIQFNMGLDGKTVPLNWFISEKAKMHVDSLFNDRNFLSGQDKILQFIHGRNGVFID